VHVAATRQRRRVLEGKPRDLKQLRMRASSSRQCRSLPGSTHDRRLPWQGPRSRQAWPVEPAARRPKPRSGPFQPGWVSTGYREDERCNNSMRNPERQKLAWARNAPGSDYLEPGAMRYCRATETDRRTVPREG
jgi:hypothetical protein